MSRIGLHLAAAFNKMHLLKFLCMVVWSFTFFNLHAQNENYQYLFGKNDTLIEEMGWYAGLLHQHQNFFGKAFSYQGIETGMIINNKILLGLFGGAFVSNLQVQENNEDRSVNSWKTGLAVGRIYNGMKTLHTGWLVHLGYFSLASDSAHFSLLNPPATADKINGWVLMPELYAEINLLKWMKVRTGLAYSFYNFEEHASITPSDLQSVGFNFGLMFGRFY